MKRYALAFIAFALLVLNISCATRQPIIQHMTPARVMPVTAQKTVKQEQTPRVVRFSFIFEPKLPNLGHTMLTMALETMKDAALKDELQKQQNSLGLTLFVEGPHPYYEKEVFISLEYLAENCFEKKSCVVPFEIGGIHFSFTISFKKADQKEARSNAEHFKLELMDVDIKEAEKLELRRLQKIKSAHHGVVVVELQ